MCIRDREKGLDTMLYKNLSEDGVEVSGGEAQKIAIARALYKDAPFIILDEPTAALDPIAEDVYKRQALLATLGIDYDAITMEQFVNLIEVLKLSKHLKTPISQRGKTTMTHGKGKRKKH